jgi:hypothetical protein
MFIKFLLVLYLSLSDIFFGLSLAAIQRYTPSPDPFYCFGSEVSRATQQLGTLELY